MGNDGEVRPERGSPSSPALPTPCSAVGSALRPLSSAYGMRPLQLTLTPLPCFSFSHINVGSRFQAEIPTLQDRSCLGNVERAALVWKPWGDIATNEETQDRGCFTLCLQDLRGFPVERASAAALCMPHPLPCSLCSRRGWGAAAAGCERPCPQEGLQAGPGSVGAHSAALTSLPAPALLPWRELIHSGFHCLAVLELLNAACSSVVPGGGTNLELALHCLHEARGNVMVRSCCCAAINGRN